MLLKVVKEHLLHNCLLASGRLLATFGILRTSLVAQLVKNLPATQEIPVRFLGQKDSLKKA